MNSVVMHCITQCVKHIIAHCNSTTRVLALVWSISVTKSILWIVLLDFPCAQLNFQNHCSSCLDMSFQKYHTESNTRLDTQILMKFHIFQKFHPLLKAQSWAWVRPIGAWGVPYLASLKASDIGWEPDSTLLGPQVSRSTPSSNSSSLEPTGEPQLILNKTRGDLENSMTKKKDLNPDGSPHVM